MRNKKAKMMRKIAYRLAGELPEKSYEQRGTTTVLGQCQRSIYKTMKLRYKR